MESILLISQALSQSFGIRFNIFFCRRPVSMPQKLLGHVYPFPVCEFRCRGVLRP